MGTELLNQRVSILWVDPQGFINAELADVAPAECVTEGIVARIDTETIVIRSSLYTGTETGDYTALPLGCVKKVDII